MGLRVFEAVQEDVRHLYSHTFTGLLKMGFYKASILPFVFTPGGEQNTRLYGPWKRYPLSWKHLGAKPKRENMASPGFMNHTNQCLYLIVKIAFLLVTQQLRLCVEGSPR